VSDHDFSKIAPAFEVSERFWNVGECKHAVDQWLKVVQRNGAIHRDELIAIPGEDDTNRRDGIVRGCIKTRARRDPASRITSHCGVRTKPLARRTLRVRYSVRWERGSDYA
jgi:hypothetical protein